MMSTKHTVICYDETIPYTLETLEECAEGWLHVTSISGPQMILCLFRELKATRTIHFHAFSCGILKIGEWELQGVVSPTDFNQIAEKTALLVEEFKEAQYIEKDKLLEHYKRKQMPVHVLYN